MEIMVFIEPVEGAGYRATSAPFPFAGEGQTPEEALRKLRELVETKLRSGARVTTLQVGTNKARVLELSGTLDLNDPVVKEWVEIMAERRREEDSMQEAS